MTSVHASTQLSQEALTRYLHDYGESVRHFFRDQQRSSMVSPLFNLPGRMVLGAYCYYENVRPLLEDLARVASPEQIGSRMRALCSRANSIHVNSIMLGYLNGREQARLVGLPKRDDREEMAYVLDFCARLSLAYRGDGHYLPDSANFSMPVLPADRVREISSLLPDDLPPETQHRLRRMMATLELYTFILNGEARIGVFHHGPYPLPSGDVLLVKELIGLRDSFYPWTQSVNQPPCNAIARVMRLRGVKTKIVQMGSLTTDPKSYEEHIVAQTVLGVNPDGFAPLTAGQMQEIGDAAGDAQLELYRRMLDWTDRYRVEYGAELYGCILHTFAEVLGIAGFAETIRTAFRRSVDRHVDDLVQGKETAAVLAHIAKTGGPIYSAFS